MQEIILGRTTIFPDFYYWLTAIAILLFVKGLIAMIASVSRGGASPAS